MPVFCSYSAKFELGLGASGGSKITTAVAQVALNVLSFCMSIRDAIDKPRVRDFFSSMLALCILLPCEYAYVCQYAPLRSVGRLPLNALDYIVLT